MEKYILSFIFSCLVLSCGRFGLIGTESNTETGANSISLHTYSVRQVKKDFEQFKSVIQKYHPMLYTDQAGLYDLFKKQGQLLKHPMGELEFYRILAPIVAKLHCGHTHLGFSKACETHYYQSRRYLPLQIKVIDKRAYVYQRFSNAEIPIGSEITSINGRSVQDIVESLLNNTTADGFNQTKKYYKINHDFNSLYFTYIETPEKFVITYIGPNREDLEITLDGVDKMQLNELIEIKSPKQHYEPYWQQFTKEFAVLTIKHFGFYDPDLQKSYKAFIDQFFKALAETGTSNMILDLRDNWGGDPISSAYLFTYLIQNPIPYFSEDSPPYGDLKQPLAPAPNNFKGNLFILINGASFSSTGHLCSLLKYHRIGFFIGNETGGSFVCTDSSRDEILKNSGIRLHYSTAVWKTAVTGFAPGRGIMPDKFVIPTIEDYLNQKDVEKDNAQDLIMGRGSDIRN